MSIDKRILENLVGDESTLDPHVNQVIARNIINSNNEQKIKAINKLRAMENAVPTTKTIQAQRRVAFSEAIKLSENYDEGLATILNRSPKFDFSTAKIRYDLKNMSRSLAMVQDRSGGYERYNGTDWDIHEVETPIIKEETEITVDQLLNDQENLLMYKDRPLEEILVDRLIDAIALQFSRSYRSVSAMTGQAFQFGKIDLSLNFKSSKIIDLHRNPNLNITASASNSWDNPDHDALGSIKLTSEYVTKVSGSVPDTIILGSNAAEYLSRNKELKERSDIRNFSLGELKLANSPIKGTKRIGSVTTGGVSYELMVVTNNTFTHPKTGVQTPYIDKDSAIFMDLKGCYPRLYTGGLGVLKKNNIGVTIDGSSKKIPGGGLLVTAGSSTMVVKLAMSEDGGLVKIFYQYAPLPIIANANATACLKVVHS